MFFSKPEKLSNSSENSPVRRWQDLQAIVDSALDLPSHSRKSFLESACNGDEALLADACRWAEAAEKSGHFLESPAADLLMSALEDEAVGQALSFSEVGPYRLVERLAVGGMGEVWLAERNDGEFEQRVAIKMLCRRFDDDEARSRLRAERQMLARLAHPNIARLFDGGTAPDGRPFLVMELIDGEPIDHFCARHGLGLDERLRLILDLSSAVAHAHQHGLVHRDLKPANVLVTPTGTVKLVDFGIAKALAPEAGLHSPNTATGRRLMTPGYASPEQIRGESISTATDVHGLGILLYEMVTGCRPFVGLHESGVTPLYSVEKAVCEGEIREPGRAVAESELARMIQTKDGDCISLRPKDKVAVLRRRLGQGLRAIMMNALAKEPTDRYASAVELTAALRKIVGSSEEPRRAARARRVARKGLGFAAAVLLGMSSLTLSGYPKVLAPAESLLGSLHEWAQPVAAQILAILPVEDLENRKNQSAVHVLLTHQLRRSLSSTPGIRVIGYRSAEPLLGNSDSSPSIAYRIGADRIFRSVVKTEPDQLIMQAVLDDGVDGKRLGSWELKAQTGEALAEKLDSVIGEIAEAMGVGPPRRRLPQVPDLEAYADLSKGRYLLYKGESGAEPFLEAALSADPLLAADAKLALARAHLWRAGEGLSSAGSDFEQALTSVREAVALDPEHADAWAVLGDLLFLYERDPRACRDALSRALSLDPSNVKALMTASELAASTGDLELGINFAEMGAELDRLNPWVRRWLGQLLVYKGDLSAAEYQANAARALASGPERVYGLLSQIYREKGKPEVARRLADREPIELFRLQAIAFSEHALGHEALAQEALDELVADWSHLAAIQIAEVYAARGDADAAFRWIHQAIDQWDGGALMTLSRPSFRALLGDVRMEQVRDRLGLEGIELKPSVSPEPL